MTQIALACLAATFLRPSSAPAPTASPPLPPAAISPRTGHSARPCRAGGLIRGYLGARIQPCLPERQTDQDLRDLCAAIPGDWAQDQGTGRAYRRPRHLPATGPYRATVLGLTHRSGAPEPTARRRSRSPDHRYLAGLSPVPAASRCTG